MQLNKLTLDHWMAAAAAEAAASAAGVLLVTAITTVKCHCQLLFCDCHGLCETHFLRLNTFCQGRNDPNSNLSSPVSDRERLTEKWLHRLLHRWFHQTSASHWDCLPQWLHLCYTISPEWTSYLCFYRFDHLPDWIKDYHSVIDYDLCHPLYFIIILILMGLSV